MVTRPGGVAARPHSVASPGRDDAAERSSGMLASMRFGPIQMLVVGFDGYHRGEICPSSSG